MSYTKQKSTCMDPFRSLSHARARQACAARQWHNSPGAQAIAAGRLLLAGMAVQDVIITLQSHSEHVCI